MIIELHLLQSFPVSNLNRDDLGQPKTARFGGVTRARVSSQSLKRAVRDSLSKYGLAGEELGKRSKRYGEKAAEILVQRGTAENLGEARRVTEVALQVLGFDLDVNRRLAYLLFLLPAAHHELADACEKHWGTFQKELNKRDKELDEKSAKKSARTTKDWVKDLCKNPRGSAKGGPLLPFRKEAKDPFLRAGQAVDIALFGRMIADDAGKNVVAASQVAHALSTHGVTTDYDYFTALDDFSRETEEPGAGMIGTVEFNTACYYRYANLDLVQLRTNLQPDEDNAEAAANLDDLMARATEAWLKAFIHAVPSGKQTTMSARTVPGTLFAVVRDHGAWNLANAFLKPVAGVDDLLAASTSRLLSHYRKIANFYDDGQIRGHVFHTLADDVQEVDDTLTTASTCKEFAECVLSAAQDAR